ncbi:MULTISPECIES: 2-dehydro-3-deoxygalactonokinase [Sphingobium]|jgi:2-dehydro-3-deoxygalactonokinase|uniref:2-dehydro-3-deoxygalactonokinase n=1 Tax=Sphingobium TaxID=165695 RepID=UPI000DBB20EA|nr:MULTISPECIES: 2-dehydro-3-deoxygalactonokinase [Sphingobium]KAA9015230.1 2-dehydro-3-deoxygalactonokinase [Sphingobium limneticum]MBU0930549.1 2-dehydro-3-deoxygalactonokinase [Alphaproteobacteria bacterium]BBD00538.1 2-dehydro-3-deoxygalactonokinase [Sphingobium sp. YG1]
MTRFAVIGDWGTSRLRLFRIEQEAIVARRDGPGIGAVGRAAEAAFADTIAPWLDDGTPESITLCGMVGARDGWVEAPYADCPADAATWRQTAVRFDWRGAPLAIMAGLACEGEDGIPDVMRGEETQIFGALALDPALATGRHLIVLPGTHNKWSLVEDGRIISFRTMPTGELFALLRDQSTLGPKVEPTDPAEEAAGFAEGLERAGDAKLLQSLFAARAMRLRSGRSGDWALGYLSGLLIGCEIAEIMTTLSGADGVVLIGDKRLSARYAQALDAREIMSRALDGDGCALAGLGFTGELTA